jgi:hypothetical protein
VVVTRRWLRLGAVVVLVTVVVVLVVRRSESSSRRDSKEMMSYVRPGVTVEQVVGWLGAPTFVDIPPRTPFVARAQACVAARSALIYQKDQEKTFVVFVDNGGRVLCSESSGAFRLQR